MAAKWQNLSDYNFQDLVPLPAAPHSRLRSENPARMLVANGDIARPWIGNPATGNAFVWPMGIEGFDINSQTTLGIHHYIGHADVDADVIFPDELRITLNGTFPGTFAAQNQANLRALLREQPPADGFVLSVPQGILENFARVVIDSSRFSHDSNDNTHSIGYEVVFLRVGIGDINNAKSKILKGSTTSGVGKASPNLKKGVGGGRSSFVVASTGSANTVRWISTLAYDDPDSGVIKIIQANEDVFRNLGIQPYEAMYKQLPPGTQLNIPE